MNRWAAIVIVLLLAASSAAAQAPPGAAGHQALRERLEKRFDLVPLTGDIGLRPKTPMGDVRLIDFDDGAIQINGAPVSGRELRDRVGADAETILQLSYLSAEARRALAAPAAAQAPPSPGVPPLDPLPPLETPGAAPAPSAEATPPAERTRPRRSSGDRVRVFGNVRVAADEHVAGQVVAVLGSVRIDGEVGDQVVAVLGSVDLGPNAVVRGDVVSVGGRVNRPEGAQIRGAVTEISFADPNIRFAGPFIAWGPWFDGFRALPRLIGTTFRFLLLVLLASIVMLVARPTVEASAQRVIDAPVQSTIIGIVAQILLIPALVLTTVILAISIIGIPLLLLVPFAILLLLVLALAGFSGTAYAIGQAARRRFSLGTGAPFADIFLGVLIVLLPILVARLIALAGWPVTPVVMVLLLIGFCVELLAWSSGFGAVLTNGYAKWQARRAARTTVPPPAPPVVPPPVEP